MVGLVPTQAGQTNGSTAVAPKVFTALGLTTFYGSGEVEVRALQDVDFEIATGETVVLLVPSGGGKSRIEKNKTRRAAAELVW
jgi:ABC-type glutathione transport system ATPase component